MSKKYTVTADELIKSSPRTADNKLQHCSPAAKACLPGAIGPQDISSIKKEASPDVAMVL
jgi:hypothetical protein